MDRGDDFIADIVNQKLKDSYIEPPHISTRALWSTYHVHLNSICIHLYCTVPDFFLFHLADVDGIQRVCVQLGCYQHVDMNETIYDALVQFSCYQH